MARESLSLDQGTSFRSVKESLPHAIKVLEQEEDVEILFSKHNNEVRSFVITIVRPAEQKLSSIEITKLLEEFRYGELKIIKKDNKVTVQIKVSTRWGVRAENGNRDNGNR